MLWHYTSADVLASILSDSVPTLRATHIHYLNDKAELRHGLNSIKLNLEDIDPIKIHYIAQSINENKHPELKSTLESTILTAIPKILDTLNDFLNDDFDPNLFSFSLSEAENSLYQWLAYCPKERGIALGFDITHEEIKNSKIIYLPIKEIGSNNIQIPQYKKCTYTEEKELSPDWYQAEPDKNLGVNLLVNAMFLKHKAFHFEQEHRLFFHPMPNHGVKVHFQNNKPFINFHFRPEILKIIYISPRGDKGQTKKIVRKILNERGLTSVDIVVSDIPFRE